MRKIFLIEGMHCAACSASVNRVVSKLTGVSYCSVSLITKKMIVEFDENLVDESQIGNAVSKAGFKMVQFVKNKNDEEIKRKLIQRKRTLILSIILLIPLLIVSI